MTQKTYDLRVEEKEKLICPNTLRKGFPISRTGEKTVLETRQEIENVLLGKSAKIIVPVGPCSIHSIDQALMYGEKLLPLKERVKDKIILVMRTYFEKPRTNTGWEGLINDPFLDQSFEMSEGIIHARKILVELNDMGIPCCMEMVTQIPAERLTGLLSWICIGARTCESSPHRKWASALSTAVGFKNGTGGQIDTAINGIIAASQKGAFSGHNKFGETCKIKSKGNPFCHIILRGGSANPNYDPVSVGRVIASMKKAQIEPNILIDCAHDNSGHTFN